jgi:hypothetical protein
MSSKTYEVNGHMHNLELLISSLQFLGFGGVGNLEWQMLFISSIISTNLGLMTTFAHKTTYTQFGKH